MKWFIKRKPTRVSFFRDHFKYLECIMVPVGAGSLWVAARSEAMWFRTSKAAHRTLRRVRRETKDKDIVVVRVSTSLPSAGKEKSDG